MKVWKGQLFHLAWMLVCAGCLSACASTVRERLDERQSQGHPRAAAYAAEGFTLDHRSPEPRPWRAWEFYYKHCALVSRNPYPNQSEFECADPY